VPQVGPEHGLRERAPFVPEEFTLQSRGRLFRPIGFVPMPQPDEHSPAVMVDASASFQTIEGIGGALTDAAAAAVAVAGAGRIS